MTNVLEIHSVTKRFATQTAVEDVSLQVRQGELFALLGPSGCGKTTVLRMVAGFETPNSGKILLNGTDIAPLKPYERNVSTVFQSYALFPHMTVRENIEFGLHRKGADDIPRRVRDAMELIRLTGKEDRKPNQLSGGERQRVALARSLVLEPDVLLLDEPLSALDPNLRKQVRNELKALQRRVGTTFIIVTHDQEEAMAMSDRIAVLNRAKLEQVGTPTEIYLQPRTKFVAGFLGAVNWLDGVGVRPESVRIADAAPGNGARSVSATVAHSLFLGNCLHVEAQLKDGAPFVAEVSRLNGTYRAGQPVHLWWNPSDELRPEV